MANISEINGYGIYAQTASLAVSSSYAQTASLANTASLAQSASLVNVNRQRTPSVSQSYIPFVGGYSPGAGTYEQLYTNDGALYVSSSHGVGNRLYASSVVVSNGFTGSLQGTASYATQALSASYAPGGSGDGGTNLGLVYAISLGYIMP